MKRHFLIESEFRKNPILALLTFYFSASILAIHGIAQGDETRDTKNTDTSPKLLIFMIDGFRWDYVEQHSLDAFEEFISEGVKAEWVEPTFPSVSYPAWTTIATGLHPESHGILGNHIWDMKTDQIFTLSSTESTKNPDFWTTGEPIWISATKGQKRVFVWNWARCDVPFDDMLPMGFCTGYAPGAEGPPGFHSFQKVFNVTLQNLRDADLLMIYFEGIDDVGHDHGPNSTYISNTLKDMNKAFKWFLDELLDHYPDLEKQLNTIIVSDHGMLNLEDIEPTYLADFLNVNQVLKVIDAGGSTAISPFPRYADPVFERLKGMPGIDLYRRNEIPEEFHYKNNRLVQEILLVSKPGYYIQGFTIPNQKIIPPVRSGSSANERWRGGGHGFYNRTEMRAIFYAKGPQFKAGHIHPPIRMEDLYQIFVKTLGIPGQPHNGTWSRVSGMFLNTSETMKINSMLVMLPFISLYRIMF